MCKHCLLPRGYSPKITNGMVRCEQAVRRLRERVDLEDSSLESGEKTKLKDWGKRLFSSSSSGHAPTAASSDVPLASMPASHASDPPEEPGPAESEAADSAASPSRTPLSIPSREQSQQLWTRPRPPPGPRSRGLGNPSLER